MKYNIKTMRVRSERTSIKGLKNFLRDKELSQQLRYCYLSTHVKGKALVHSAFYLKKKKNKKL